MDSPLKSSGPAHTEQCCTAGGHWLHNALLLHGFQHQRAHELQPAQRTCNQPCPLTPPTASAVHPKPAQACANSQNPPKTGLQSTAMAQKVAPTAPKPLANPLRWLGINSHGAESGTVPHSPLSRRCSNSRGGFWSGPRGTARDRWTPAGDQCSRRRWRRRSATPLPGERSGGSTACEAAGGIPRP